MSDKITVELSREIRKLRVGKIRILVETQFVPLKLQIQTLATYGAVTYQSRVTPYISMVVDVEKVEEIAKLPWVKKVWHVPPVFLFPQGSKIVPAVPTPAQMTEVTLIESARHIAVDQAKAKGYTGKGVLIALVDSGIESTHPMLIGKVVAEKNFSEGPDVGDRAGHGTHCASILVGGYWDTPQGPLEGMAPDARLINAKVFEGPSQSTDIVMAGLEWASQQGAHISSNSWGASSPYEPLRQLILALKQNYGTIFVCAGGNEGPTSGTIGYPGGYTEVVGVGSVAVKNPAPDTVSDFSSRGPNFQGQVKPDIMAPGGNAGGAYEECILAAGLGGSVACHRGTSMATPHIAGALALLLEAGYGRESVSNMYESARDLLATGKDNDSGFGTADIGRALEIPLPPLHTLSIDSNLKGVPFAVDGTTDVTPWSGQLFEGIYALTVPARVVIEDVAYDFSKWEDETTYPVRRIELTKDIAVTAYYVVAPTHILSIETTPVKKVPFTLNGMEGKTPWSAEIGWGIYTVEVPWRLIVDGENYNFVGWEDGSKDVRRTIELLADTTIMASYEAGPAVPVTKIYKTSAGVDDAISMELSVRHWDWLIPLYRGAYYQKGGLRWALRDIPPKAPIIEANVILNTVWFRVAPMPEARVEPTDPETFTWKTPPTKKKVMPPTPMAAKGIIESVEIPTEASATERVFWKAHCRNIGDEIGCFAQCYYYHWNGKTFKGTSTEVPPNGEIWLASSFYMPERDATIDIILERRVNGELPCEERTRGVEEDRKTVTVKLSAEPPPPTYKIGRAEIQLFDQDNCEDFSRVFWKRPVTGSIMNWDILFQEYIYDGDGYSLQTSPSIKELIQAYVNRPEYHQGNYVGLRLQPVGDWDEHAEFVSYDGAIASDILKDTQPTLEVTFIPPAVEIPTHALSINSEPIAVRFTIDGVEATTPHSATTEEGPYTIEMPSNVVVNGDTYNFVRWEDGSTNPVRTINLTTDMTLTAHYEFVPPPPPAKGILDVHAFADSKDVAAQVEIVTIGTYTTPFNIELDPADYTLNATYQDQSDTKTVTVPEGKTVRVDFQFVTPPKPPIPTWLPFVAIPIIGGVLYLATKEGAK